MSYQFKLQVAISKELNEKLKERVTEVGLNSVADIARMLLTNFANRKMELVFVDRSLQRQSSTIVSQSEDC